MSLEGLAKTGRIKPHPVDRSEIRHIALDPNRMVVLDALRRKRNLNDYLGADLDEATAEACRKQAASLLADVHAWLQANHPGWA